LYFGSIFSVLLLIHLLTFTHGLELKHVELGALLRVINPGDQPVVTLLESIHLNSSLLLKSRSLNVLFTSLWLLGILCDSFLIRLSISLLGSLDSSNQLLLLRHLSWLATLGDSLLLLLMLFH
jgi:hypothetical protein